MTAAARPPPTARRRRTAAGAPGKPPPSEEPIAVPSRRPCRSFAAAATAVAAAAAAAVIMGWRRVAPDNEAHIRRLRLPLYDGGGGVREGVGEGGLLVCIPTVARTGGVEYVSNAVKSWAVATDGGGGGGGRGRLVVFEMDVGAAARAAHQELWLPRVFGEGGGRGRGVDWLTVEGRRREHVREPMRRTHGDGEARVRWRAKEALDYAEVLERCAELAGDAGKYVAVVQDDVLFTRRFAVVLGWLDGLERVVGEAWCSASLFDLDVPGGVGWEWGDVGAAPLGASNMVGRVWYVGDGGVAVRRFVANLRAKFDVSPVDWLADAWCRKRRQRCWTAVPSLLKHRGRVSSFAENRREGTLT